ncbi:hypothetical protein [Streptomyces sp. NPDC048560]|uniref:SCO2583 family membrane protein n=1 Tax=Streptomyces sp. NPDC048560 TaxID=3155488 RepID=UPI003443650B
MTGRGEPPENPPDEPAGGEDEYRSLVFDESFIRAARLQEFSAQERMGDHALAVRSLPGRAARHGSKAAIALVLLIALAFTTAVYIGFRSNPYPPPTVRRAEPLKATVVPLAPRGAVPGGTPAALYEASPAAAFRSGGEGITFPGIRRTHSFSVSQITAALTTAKDYLVGSSLDPDVLSGASTRPVERLLDPGQTAQFDRSVNSPADDGRHSATGWLVRFDPATVELADPNVRVKGTLAYAEVGADTLEVVSDHTFTYALRPVGSGPRSEGDASLFTVRRELRFQLDREDLRLHRLEVRTAQVQAGPQSCSADTADSLVPLLAGQRADDRGPAGTDPYATGPRPTALCGTLVVSSAPARNSAQGPAADASPSARP